MYIKVKVTPDAKKEEIKQKNKDTYIISVCQKAERNQANKRIVELMALIYKVPINRVRIISGHRQISKIVSIDI
jgi:uncharacterized protein